MKMEKTHENRCLQVTDGSYVDLRQREGRETVRDALSGNVPGREPTTNGFESAKPNRGG
jgi:hypothetical protein